VVVTAANLRERSKGYVGAMIAVLFVLVGKGVPGALFIVFGLTLNRTVGFIAVGIAIGVSIAGACLERLLPMRSA